MNATWDGSEPCPYALDYTPSVGGDQCGRDTRSFDCNFLSIDSILRPSSVAPAVLKRGDWLGGILTAAVMMAVLL